MFKPKILALTNPSAVSGEYLASFRQSFQLDICTSKTRAEAIPEIATKVTTSGPYDAFIILMGTKPYEDFDADFLGALVPDCKIIVSASAGYDEFDVDWMTSQEIWFCNTRNAVSECTADMSMFLILATLKDTTRAEESARRGEWRKDHVPTMSPSGLALGILGMGAIGKHLARKADIFNMKIQYYNRTRLSPEIESELKATYCNSLESLLQTSDVISINCPLNATTRNFINAKEFAVMKDGAFLVNTARGAIVNESALIAALESGKVKRAGLDCFEKEPAISQYFKERSDKVTIQPHLGGLTNVAAMKAQMECFENIKAFFSTGKPNSPVNEISSKA